MTVDRRVAAYRQRMRASGLRPVQLWVPDVRAPEFADVARRECEAINATDPQEDIFEFLEETAAAWDDE